MRIISWNILQGGGKRMPGVVDAINDAAADVVVLQEFRNNRTATALLDALHAQGLEHIHTAGSEARKNTAMIASRHALQVQAMQPEQVLDTDLAFTASIDVPGHDPLRLHAMHSPQKRKQLPYFHALNELPLDRQTPTAVIGDLNNGIPFEDSETKSFSNTHLFQSLLQAGWVDAWRSRYPDAREFTWISSRGNGFRYDHCLCNAAFDDRIGSIHYDHSVRQSGLSDHSMLVIDTNHKT